MPSILGEFLILPICVSSQIAPVTPNCLNNDLVLFNSTMSVLLYKSPGFAASAYLTVIKIFFI